MAIADKSILGKEKHPQGLCQFYKDLKGNLFKDGQDRDLYIFVQRCTNLDNQESLRCPLGVLGFLGGE